MLVAVLLSSWEPILEPEGFLPSGDILVGYLYGVAQFERRCMEDNE